MNSKRPKQWPGRKKLTTAKRRGIEASQEAWIKTEHLDAVKQLPLVVRPAIDSLDLIEWATNNRNLIESLLLKHRAILFRDFGVNTVKAFERFVKVTAGGELLAYRDRSTPRETRGENIYTSTVYPADQRINLHNEGTYWLTWPLKIYFCCMKAPQEGGETPIADVTKVLQRMDPLVRDRFIEKEVMYVRNYNDGFGLSWQEVFQTTDVAEVETYCRRNGIDFEWKSNNRLRTRQIRPAVRKHPITGEAVWFNHAAFFHVSALEPVVRETLLSEFPEADLPYQTYYGDGTPIDPGDVTAILSAYQQEQVVFPWQEGDILMQDNMSVAHGREPFVGEREVLTAMTNPVLPEPLASNP